MKQDSAKIQTEERVMRPIPRILGDTDDYQHRRIIPKVEGIGKEPRRRELQSGAPKLRGRICGPDG